VLIREALVVRGKLQVRNVLGALAGFAPERAVGA